MALKKKHKPKKKLKALTPAPVAPESVGKRGRPVGSCAGNVEARIAEMTRWAIAGLHTYEIIAKAQEDFKISKRTAFENLKVVTDTMTDAITPEIQRSYTRMVTQLRKIGTHALQGGKPDYKSAVDCVRAEVELAKLFRVKQVDVNIHNNDAGTKDDMYIRLKNALGTSAAAEVTQAEIKKSSQTGDDTTAEDEQPTLPPGVPGGDPITDEATTTGIPPVE